MKKRAENIQQTLDAIYSFVDYSLTHANQISPDVFSLTKIEQLLSQMSNPHLAYKVVHVAGTKGKGSTCAMISSGLRAAGFKVGLYTSPHLIRFNERIQINGKMISDQELIDCFNKIIPYVDESNPVSTFEITTAIAFEFFREKHVDYAVIETGLGGRLDATNVVKPILSVITSISIDHTTFLGNTLSLIAAEKGGIIKGGVPVIVAKQKEEAKSVLRVIAAEKKSEWIDVENEYGAIPVEEHAFSQKIAIWKKTDQLRLAEWLEPQTKGLWKPEFVTIPFSGLHQAENAVAAYAALTAIKKQESNVDTKIMTEGLSETFWPCRFEKIQESPLIIADGAHNLDSIQKLIFLFNRFFGNREIICVFGASADKKCNEMINELAPNVSRFIVTRSTHPRAAIPKDLYDMVIRCGKQVLLTDCIEEAYDIICNSENDGIYIVTGSLFVAAGFREIVMQRKDNLPYFN